MRDTWEKEEWQDELDREFLLGQFYLGKDMKDLRKKSGYNQQEFARELGIHFSYLSGVESGKHFPSIKILQKICNLLNVEFVVSREGFKLKSRN